MRSIVDEEGRYLSSVCMLPTIMLYRVGVFPDLEILACGRDRGQDNALKHELGCGSIIIENLDAVATFPEMKRQNQAVWRYGLLASKSFMKDGSSRLGQGGNDCSLYCLYGCCIVIDCAPFDPGCGFVSRSDSSSWPCPWLSDAPYNSEYNRP